MGLSERRRQTKLCFLTPSHKDIKPLAVPISEVEQDQTKKTDWILRPAAKNDIPQMAELIPRSSFVLQKDDYTPEQINAALGPVFGVDEQLIEDGTYYVVEENGKIIGCGGWSFRKSLFGGSEGRVDPELDPKTDPARIRAYFVDPAHARKGVATAIMNRCEEALAEMGFTRVEISATLAGEPFYARFGYESIERYHIPLDGAPPMEVVKMTKNHSSSQTP